MKNNKNHSFTKLLKFVILELPKLPEEEGREQGRVEGKLQDARNALAKGYSVETIQDITGLPMEEIEKLQP